MTKPIQDKFLDRNQLFGLRYKEGVVFLQVRELEDTQFKPFSGLEDIEASTSLDRGFQRLEDTNGDDILFVDSVTDKFKVIHVGIGQMPTMVRRFTRYPENSAKLRTIPNIEIPSTSDPNAYVDGFDSPYDEPTDAEELVIPPGQHLAFDFFNPDTDDHEPILHIKMRKYVIEVLNPRGTQAEKDAIRRIIRIGSSIPIFPVGSLDNQAQFNLGKEWGVKPVEINRARELVE